jgi:hypothetical protein
MLPFWSLAGGFVEEWDVLHNQTIRLSDYGIQYFFLLSNYWNIKYLIGQFKKLSDYGILDHKASIYRTIRYRTQKKLSVAHLWIMDWLLLMCSKKQQHILLTI